MSLASDYKSLAKEGCRGGGAFSKASPPLPKRGYMKHVDIYTDGACKHNPGPGGWGAIIVYKQTEKELAGGEERTTNNRMELLGRDKCA